MLPSAAPVLVALFALAPTPSGNTDDADALRAALRAVPSVRYTATYRRTLSLALETWVVEGRVELASTTTALGAAARIDARVQPPRGGAPFDVSLLWRDGLWTLVDRGARSVARAPDPRQLGPAAEVVAPLALAVLTDRAAFDRMDEIRRLEPTSYDEETCDVFRVRARADASESKWYVSRTSRLPRLVTGVRWLPAAERLVESLRLSQLVPGGEPRAASFVLEPPRGFEERAPLDPATLATPERALQTLTSLAASLEPLREHFDASRGKLRLIGLFAPT